MNFEFLMNMMVFFTLGRTRAVQKLLEHVTTQYQRTIIISALVPGVVALTNDINGHHVILHCLKHFSDEHKKVMYVSPFHVYLVF